MPVRMRPIPLTPAFGLHALGVLAVGLLAAWAYAPGLSGGFLFDDFANLPALGATGPVEDWATFWRYLTSGHADPTGRPLALLSFLLDARGWPADPGPFLRTNLALHLLNGGLLFALLRALGRSGGGRDARRDASGEAHASWAALLGAGLWLLHPLLVSTTLYIVQREAMLPATCVLLGLLAWLHGRRQLDRAPRGGAAWMLAGIGLGTALAVLAKGNGVLLPLLAWVLEATVLRPPADAAARARLRRWTAGLLVLPSLAVLAWLASFLPALDAPVAQRPWTIGQRLLTEARVLLDYLQLLAVPRPLSTGLYNDGYVVSTGLATPGGTLPAVCAVLALVAVAFALRRRAPDWSAALLFFFAGHLLESTVVPLELYFEHRNYLPALLLFWPLARALTRWRAPAWAPATVAGLALLLLAATTHQRASTWGDPARMALSSAAKNPRSARAQAAAAMAEMDAGDAAAALRRLHPLWQREPMELQYALNWIDAACRTRGLAPAEAKAATRAFAGATHGQDLAHDWLRQAQGVAFDGSCPGLAPAQVVAWTDALAGNPAMQAPARRADAANLRGRLALRQARPAAALRHFDQALAARVAPETAAAQAALLASAGQPRLALAHLDHYQRLAPTAREHATRGMPWVHAWVLRRQGYWPRELARLRAVIEADLAAPRAAGSAG